MPESEHSTHARLHAVISGHVQGVGFRFFTREQARCLLLSGWVRNLPDGSVEVTAEGPRADLEQLLDILHRGPTGARVRDLRFTWQPPTSEFTDFRVGSI
ncbi:MAG: acylphosphatase [Chloroflexi bacterium]|nr:acylphosphatase [Chloroflexota bacterium]